MVERIEAMIRRAQAERTIAPGLDANNAALIIVGSAHVLVQMKGFSRTHPEPEDSIASRRIRD
jgi:hypothetical protein